jgi:hypothetical protein
MDTATWMNTTILPAESTVEVEHGRAARGQYGGRSMMLYVFHAAAR